MSSRREVLAWLEHTAYGGGSTVQESSSICGEHGQKNSTQKAVDLHTKNQTGQNAPQEMSPKENNLE